MAGYSTKVCRRMQGTGREVTKKTGETEETKRKRTQNASARPSALCNHQSRPLTLSLRWRMAVGPLRFRMLYRLGSASANVLGECRRGYDTIRYDTIRLRLLFWAAEVVPWDRSERDWEWQCADGRVEGRCWV
jgi:hypothetical protein